jgi:hypothetical protein
MRSLTPIDGHPDLYRTDDGRVVNLCAFSKFDTAHKVVGTEWNEVATGGVFLTTWHFTVSVWPKDGREAQQLVQLIVEDKMITEVCLGTILSDASRPFVLNEEAQKLVPASFGMVPVKPQMRIRVCLTERPVEVGLRLHFHGLRPYR